jgi:hypothetical protein
MSDIRQTSFVQQWLVDSISMVSNNNGTVASVV